MSSSKDHVETGHLVYGERLVKPSHDDVVVRRFFVAKELSVIWHTIKRAIVAASKVLVLAMLIGLAPGVSARAATGLAVTGGGSASDMTRFALAINGGTGHFECLMPAVMTVEAEVTGIDTISSTTASFHGVATVTLAANNPFGLPAGPMARGVSFTAGVVAGGPGIGFVDLEIMGMSFKGTVEHGQVSVSP